MYRVGVIGCGNIFPMHGISINGVKNATVVAVSDVKEDRGNKVAKNYNCQFYADYKEMIDKENLDVVHVCTPHYLHPEMVIYALEKGCHVLTEKPMSIKLEDAKAMVDAGTASGKTFGVIFQNRYNPGSVLIKEALEDGTLGKIKGVRLSVTWDRSDEYYSKSDWKGTWDKEGGGVIIDQAIHTFDLMRWFVNSEIDYIDANISNRAHEQIEVEDSAEGVVKFKNGVATAFHCINYYTYDSPVELELHCENGVANIYGDKGTITLNNNKIFSANREDVVMDYGDGVKGYWGVSHIKQIENFYNALDNGTEPDITGKIAYETQKMICGIYDSGKGKTRINF
ncbi:MAG: Gfo/Idh/MocA family protein [Lachnospirales bacterium]